MSYLADEQPMDLFVYFLNISKIVYRFQNKKYLKAFFFLVLKTQKRYKKLGHPAFEGKWNAGSDKLNKTKKKWECSARYL